MLGVVGKAVASQSRTHPVAMATVDAEHGFEIEDAAIALGSMRPSVLVVGLLDEQITERTYNWCSANH